MNQPRCPSKRGLRSLSAVRCSVFCVRALPLHFSHRVPAVSSLLYSRVLTRTLPPSSPHTAIGVFENTSKRTRKKHLLTGRIQAKGRKRMADTRERNEELSHVTCSLSMKLLFIANLLLVCILLSEKEKDLSPFQRIHLRFRKEEGMKDTFDPEQRMEEMGEQKEEKETHDENDMDEYGVARSTWVTRADLDLTQNSHRVPNDLQDQHKTAAPLEFIYILSRQRSGSTSLTSRIAGINQPCSFNMNEALNYPLDPQHGILKDPTLFREFKYQEDLLTALEYLRDQRETYCNLDLLNLPHSLSFLANTVDRRSLGEATATVKSIARKENSDHEDKTELSIQSYCSNRGLSCIGVLKLFDKPDWGQSGPQDSVGFSQFVELISGNFSLNLILERDPAEQECSLNWAKHTGDWGTCPSCHSNMTSKQAREEFYSKCPRQASTEFQAKNDKWFATVKQVHKATGKAYLEVPFSAHRSKSKEDQVISVVEALISA